MWPVSFVVGVFAVSNFNARVDLEDRWHGEFVRALKAVVS